MFDLTVESGKCTLVPIQETGSGFRIPQALTLVRKQSEQLVFHDTHYEGEYALLADQVDEAIAQVQLTGENYLQPCITPYENDLK